MSASGSCRRRRQQRALGRPRLTPGAAGLRLGISLDPCRGVVDPSELTRFFGALTIGRRAIMAIEHASASAEGGRQLAPEPAPRLRSLICPVGTQGMCAPRCGALPLVSRAVVPSQNVTLLGLRGTILLLLASRRLLHAFDQAFWTHVGPMLVYEFRQAARLSDS
jgi:hypothetical protein